LAAVRGRLVGWAEGSPHYWLWNSMMEHVTSTVMLPRAARSDNAPLLLAAYLDTLDLSCLRGRHKYANVSTRFVRSYSLLSDEERAWFDANLSSFIEETGAHLLKDEGVEMHVVLKLKRALAKTDEESGAHGQPARGGHR
jgi:hypothetical protein